MTHVSFREVAKLKQKAFRAVLLPALALCICNLPASATIIFSDLGPPGNAYNSGSAQDVCGAGGCGAMQIADEFTAGGSGGQSVTQIDLAVENFNMPGVTNFLSTFDAFIFNVVTVNTQDQPGTTIIGEWDGLTAQLVGTGALVSVPVTGVTLFGGTKYFMVLKPKADSTFDLWYDNNQGNTGTVLNSPDGSNWVVASSMLNAFDVVASPEPGTMLLFGFGMIAIVGARRQKRDH